MNILTTQGYKPIENIVSSDNLIAYDVYTGNQIINHLIYKQKWTEYVYEETRSVVYSQWDGNNNLVGSSTLFDYPWQFYKINDTWTLYEQESIWVNADKVVHVSELQIGDIIYDENNNDIVITDIQPVTSSEWWRVSISGDHSYIADGLTLHNPSRYWVGGGSSTNYNATANTNWASTSGGANNASVPTASDDIFYDGSGSRANDNCVINSTFTVTNMTFSSSYTGSWSIGNFTFTNNGNFTCASGTNFVVTNANATLGMGGNGTIATNGKIMPFRMNLAATATTRSISGSDLTAIHTFSSSAAGAGFNYSSNNILNSNSNERLVTCGFTGPTGGGVLLSGSADIYVIGGTVNFGAFTDSNVQRSRLYISSSIANLPVTLSRVVATYIEYVGGTVNTAASQLGLGTSTSAATLTVLNTPGVTWSTVAGINTANPGIFLSASLTASTIQNGLTLPANTTFTFTGSAGFLCGNLNFSGTTNRTLVLQAGNTYIVTGSLNIGVATGTTFPNIVTSGSGGGGLARPKLILQQGATCQAAANFIQIDASEGRTINTFSGSLTNTTNIRSFTDLSTVAYSSVG